MNWLLHGLAALLGVSTLAIFAPTPAGQTSRPRAIQAKPKAIQKATAQRLQLPRRPNLRIRPSRVTKRPGMGPQSPTTPQRPTINPLTVTVNGQVFPAISANSNATFLPAPGAGQWFNLKILVQATGQEELFLLGVPFTPASTDAPLLVGFRQSNVSHGDVLNHTDFWDECLARGWYMLAPLSRGIPGHETTSGAALNAQLNTEAALRWVTDRYPIDDDRIYGVGFSGGASLLGSYAARHLDPRAPMFAAIAYHTGASDLVDVFNSKPAGQTALIKVLGGTAMALPFEYRQVSMLELDALQAAPLPWLPGGYHMAVNLGSIPTQIWYSVNDPNIMLRDHTDELFDWMNLNGNGPVSLITGSIPSHTWDLLDEVAICNWFDTQTLTPPTSGSLLIDRDARFHYFDVQQAATGAFTRLDFDIMLANNELSLTQTDNLAQVSCSAIELGLFTLSGVYLTLNLDAVDAGDDCVLRDVPQSPVSVTRDGMPDLTWVYSAMDETLTITEPQTGPHTWVIQF